VKGTTSTKQYFNHITKLLNVMNINQIIAYICIYCYYYSTLGLISELILNDQQRVPPTLEQCTIRDPIENTHGVKYYFILH
jgi:hypothetical protein